MKSHYFEVRNDPFNTRYVDTLRKQAERHGIRAGQDSGKVRRFLRERLKHRDDLADLRGEF